MGACVFQAFTTFLCLYGMVWYAEHYGHREKVGAGADGAASCWQLWRGPWSAVATPDSPPSCPLGAPSSTLWKGFETQLCVCLQVKLPGEPRAGFTRLGLPAP